jgi:hypothetical protein
MKFKPKNRAKHTLWQSMFYITPVEEYPYVKFGPFKIKTKHPEYYYELRDRTTDTCIAKYSDFKYAAHQAWYKYKKTIKKIDRILLVDRERT